MVQKWMQAFALLLFCQKTFSAKRTVVEERTQYDITCSPGKARTSMVLWFRVPDNGGIEFIASFGSNGQRKTNLDNNVFLETSYSRTIRLRSFKKDRDSGVYSCASINDNSLVFGEVTRLAGPDPPKTTTAPLTTTEPNPSTTTTTTKPCICNSNKGVNPSVSCDIMVWAPLTAVCGLFLILLIITICHCNRIRTRRCPHHYKRQPRMEVSEKQHPMTKRNV